MCYTKHVQKDENGEKIMAEITLEQANTPAQSNFFSTKGLYFSLKNHKDSAVVRFLYKDQSDIKLHVVHEVKNERGFNEIVNCIREYGQPKSACPLCAAKIMAKTKVFIPLYDEAQQKVLIWTRTKDMANNLSTYAEMYNPLVNQRFKVVRNGVAKSQQTSYSLMPLGDSPVELESLGEIPPILGGFIKDLTAEEMTYYLDYNEPTVFKEDGQEVESPAPVVETKKSATVARVGKKQTEEVPF